MRFLKSSEATLILFFKIQPCYIQNSSRNVANGFVKSLFCIYLDKIQKSGFMYSTQVILETGDYENIIFGYFKQIKICMDLKKFNLRGK